MLDLERDDTTIRFDNFIGVPHDSPSGEFVLATGIYIDDDSPEDTIFVLLRNDRRMVDGRVDERILDAQVCDSGHFILRLDGGGEASSLRTFSPAGEPYWQRSFANFVLSFDVSTGGGHVLWVQDEILSCVDTSRGTAVFDFAVPRFFYPERVQVDYGMQTVRILHSDGQWYRFSLDGVFLDESEWTNRYMEAAEGPILYSFIKELYAREKPTEPQEIATYALWVEEAIRRGIEDSFSLQVSSVYLFLGSLHDAAGNPDLAARARAEAEAKIDGFRLADRVFSAVASLKQQEDGPDAEVLRGLIESLDRAEGKPRVSDYPNYTGRINRFRGELYERLGDLAQATENYRRALAINPKVGCKRQLEKMEKRLAAEPRSAKR